MLVDTDYAGIMPAFYGAIKKYNIKVSDISCVLATHYHPDNIGVVTLNGVMIACSSATTVKQ